MPTDLDAEWAAYDRTLEAQTIRLRASLVELRRAIGGCFTSFAAGYRRAVAAHRARQQSIMEAEGGQQ